MERGCKYGFSEIGILFTLDSPPSISTPFLRYTLLYIVGNGGFKGLFGRVAAVLWATREGVSPAEGAMRGRLGATGGRQEAVGRALEGYSRRMKSHPTLHRQYRKCGHPTQPFLSLVPAGVCALGGGLSRWPARGKRIAKPNILAKEFGGFHFFPYLYPLK